MRSALQPANAASSIASTPIIRHLDKDLCMALDIVIMAAGKGTRMKSSRAKVLHELAGRSLLQHVLQSAATLGADRIIVVTGHGADEVEAASAAPGVRFVRQVPQLGTGHAVQQAAPLLHDS